MKHKTGTSSNNWIFYSQNTTKNTGGEERIRTTEEKTLSITERLSPYFSVNTVPLCFKTNL